MGGAGPREDATRAVGTDTGVGVAHFFSSKDFVHHLVEAGSNELRSLFGEELHHTPQHCENGLQALRLHLLKVGLTGLHDGLGVGLEERTCGWVWVCRHPGIPMTICRLPHLEDTGPIKKKV